MINSTIVGNLGAEPRRSEDGKRTSVSVASSHGWNEKRTTTWVSCTLFGKTAEWVAANVHKGDKVAVCGKLYLREHDGKSYLCCDADSFDRLSEATPKPASGGGSAGEIPFA